jgi:3-methyladenine DNA glycosylase AlkD
MPNPSDTSITLPDNPDPELVVDALTGAFKRFGDDEAYQEGIMMAVPGVQAPYGVRVPVLRDLAGQVFAKYPKQDDALIKISEALWTVGRREHRMVALFLLGRIRTLDAATLWRFGCRFLPDVADWETCDQLCAALLGVALSQDPVYMDDLEEWVTEEDFWVRRAALVTTVYLRKARFDESLAQRMDQRALELCNRLLEDPEKYVRKAVDWAVRETIKRNYDLGFQWMMAQAEEPLTPIARSTLKLSSKKLTDADQRQFLSLIENAVSK